MRISTRLYKCAVNNTITGCWVLGMLAFMLLGFHHLKMHGLARLCCGVIGLDWGWCLGLWSAAWMAQIAENHPETFDE